ncbi:MAG: GatB/YqeY domain-containing protein [Lysobacterales bacterium]|nr:GatB/YqeY domain-containing protein [Xanthomonadales bacterium]MCB1611009.1 GatB/YqeY domain-containing protein [Xanthomonadales bacterium]MCP5476081.1 GatB/YqeY domain-containing protein [Rhodanobacteraceae bacterium]
MSLKARLMDDVKAAMKGGDKERLATLRLITSAIKQVEIDSRAEGERLELGDAEVLAVLEKMLKQRRDSIQQFEAAGRQDLADKEKAEVVVIDEYMPARLSDADLDALIREAMTETGATTARDMGKVMAAMKAKAAGRADMQLVSARVKALLG